MKDSSKNKEWERRRRDRLNDAFKKLAQILPNYDPAAKTPKIDVLEKAAQFIKELRLSNSRLVSQQTQSDEKSKLISELQDESNKLILRVKQLTALLKQAKIRIPLGPSLNIGKKQGKWSNQLTSENVENSTKQPEVENAMKNGKEDTPLNPTVQDKEMLTNIKSAPPQTQSISPSNGTPLKETNTDKESVPPTPAPVPEIIQTQIQPQTINISPIMKPIVQQVPLPTTTTIILTSCPIPNPLAHVTRMTIAPTRILPKPGELNHLQKIAILPIRKALPPKEKKRRNRAKKVKVAPAETAKSSKSTNTNTVPDVPTPEPEIHRMATRSSDANASTQMAEKVTKVNNNQEDIKKSKDKSETVNSPKKVAPEIIDLTDEKSQECTTNNNNQGKSNAEKENAGSLSKKRPSSIPCPKSKKGTQKDSVRSPSKHNVSKMIAVAENSTKVAEQDKQPTADKSLDLIPEVSGEEAEKILQSDSIESVSGKEAQNSTKNQIGENRKASEESLVALNSSANSSRQNNKLEALRDPEETVELSSEALRNDEPTAMEVENIGNSNENDKISECIARSIDLIDPPVGELMELSGDWGEAHSPKSPISPTQMFLSMFPLLPRESIVSASETQSSTCKSSMQFSSVRSSFFIDAMLPEENSNNTDTVTSSSNSNNTTTTRNAGLNPSSTHSTSISSNSSSNFMNSSYNSLVGTTCLAVPPVPVPQRQETSHFHNLDTLNFISSAPPTSTFQTPSISSPKKSSTINSNTNIGMNNNLNDFRSNVHPPSIANSSVNVNHTPQNNIVPSSESSHYKNQNFSQYPTYMHPQPIQNNRQTLPPISIQSHNNNPPNNHQTQKKHSSSQQQSDNKNSSNSSASQKVPSMSTSQVESSSSSAPPISRVAPLQSQSQMIPSSDSQNIFRNVNPTSSITQPPIPNPTPHIHQNLPHQHHHHPYQPPTYHHSPSTTQKNSRETSKTQNYQNSYTGDISSNNSQSHTSPVTSQKQQKSQIFRPGLTDFNMSARMHTQIHQQEPQPPPTPVIIPHSQSYSSNSNLQSKSHAPTSSSSAASVTYSNNNLNLQQNSGNHHNQNYPMQPQPIPQQQSNSNLFAHNPIPTQNQSQNQTNTPMSHTHSQSASTSSSSNNVSKQQRQYSHNSGLELNSYTVRPPQQQTQPETQSHPPTNHSSTNKSHSSTQNQNQQQQSHSHSHRSSSSQNQSQNQNQQQQGASSRNQTPKGINSSHANSNTNNSSSISTSRSSNNPPENSFHLDFSSVIPTPLPIPPIPSQPILPQTNRHRNTHPPLSSHSGSGANNQNPPQSIPPSHPPLQMAPPIPDFSPSPAPMNFNQYHHHHDPNIHSSSGPPNYLAVRHPPPPTPTPSRATPFYLQEVFPHPHPPDCLPILPPHPHPPHNPNQIQSNNNLNNSKTNFNINPPAPPPPVYSHPVPVPVPLPHNSHHNKNYFPEHTLPHPLYQHSLNNIPQPHLQMKVPPVPPRPSLATPVPPPPIYSHPVHTPHVSHRHQQNCNVVGPPSQHQQNQQQTNTISRTQQQQPHPQQNKSHSSSKQQQQQQSNPTQNQSSNQNQNHYPVQQSSNNSSNANANNNSNCNNQQQQQQQQRPTQNPSSGNSNNNNNANNPIIPVPQPQPQSQPNNNSSRPVNWMTDPPHRKPVPLNNTFSVSKLVGNSSFVANNSYCAEALIRKNPEWNDFHFTPPTPTIPPPPPPQHSHPPHTFVPYQAQNEHPAYSNFTHQYTPNPPPLPTPTHFGHFDNSQQHQNHHHHQHHLPHHVTTSSVSNFNLSSIFPEINDKRTNTSNNNTSSTNANSNAQDSNTTNRCNNYYSGKHAK